MKINQRKAGVLLSYSGEAVKILVNLIYTPIMLRLLGQNEWGLYQLVFSIVSYLSLLSLGFSGSYMRFYSRYKAKNDNENIARLNGMFMTIFAVISLICLICGAIMVANIHHIFGNGLTPSEYETARVLMVLMVFNLAITFPKSVFDCCVTAHEQFLFQKLLLLLQNLLSPFLTLPLLIMGYASIGMVAVTTFLTVATLIANIVFCFKKLHVRFVFNGFKLSLLKEMWIFTFFIFLNQIIDQINWSIDKFLLGRMTGTVAVGIYGVAAQIHNMYLQLSTSVSNVFVPKVNKIVAETNDNSELTKLFTKVGRIQFLILALVLSGFIFFGVPFIDFWAGENYGSAYRVALFLMIPVTVPLIQNLGIEIQRAKNMHKARSVVYLCIAISNIFVSIPLIKHFGISGAACGTALTLIAGNIIFMNWYYHTHIGLNIIYFWKQIASFIPALIIPTIFGIVFMNFVNLHNFIAFTICILVYAVVYFISMWLFGMNKDEKNLIAIPMKKILKREK